LTPAADIPTSMARMTLTGLLVDADTVAADCDGFSSVALGWRHELDAAVAVLVVVAIHELRHPGAGLLDVGEWLAWVVRHVPHRAEQRLRVGVVVADLRSGE